MVYIPRDDLPALHGLDVLKHGVLAGVDQEEIGYMHGAPPSWFVLQ